MAKTVAKTAATAVAKQAAKPGGVQAKAGAKAATAPAAARAGAGGGGRLRGLALMIVALPVIGILLPSTIVLTALTLPSVVAYLIDRRPERYLTMTVGMLNICGALPSLWDLWMQGQTYGAALGELLDLMGWLSAYGAAAGGWVIYLFAPPFVTTYYNLMTQARLLSLQRRQQQLIAAWGDEVAAGHEIESREERTAA